MENQKRKPRKKLHEISLEQDIRYRGPLSYRHLKIAGWLCIAGSQLLILINFFNTLRPGSVDLSVGVTLILLLLASLPVPLFLLSQFSLILDSDKGYKRVLLANGLAAAGVIVIFLLIYLRYGVGICSLFTQDKHAATALLDQVFSSTVADGKAAFNVFVDFFLCALFMLFLRYRPSRFFTGKKIRIFRAFALIPVLYEVASQVLRYLAVRQMLILPVSLFPFLTVKPPLLFLVFIILAFFIKNRERLFCQNGRTHAEYAQFLKTNRNSLHFSVFTAIVFLAAGLIDLILYLVLFYLTSKGAAGAAGIIRSLDFGNSWAGLILLAPFVLLFSYTRKYSSSLPDIAIPAGGIALVILVYLEVIFQALRTLLA